MKIIKKIKYIFFFTLVFYSCTNSRQKERILELEEENRLSLTIIDSLKQTDAFKFNEILLKELGKPDDTVLIKEYEAFLNNAQSDFWKNFVNNRISIIKTRATRQSIEKKIFGTWEWVETDGGWGVMQTPETENITRKIVISNDYTIQYFKNGTKIKQDGFYITTVSVYPMLGSIALNDYFTIIHLINQNKDEAFQIVSAGHAITGKDELIFYTPWIWGMDFPSEKYKRITKQ